MPKRRVVKERALKELYEITRKLSEPEGLIITPVLKGSCRIQGPVDDLDQELRANTVLSAEENFGSASETIHMRAESGTCNVCAAPCSSCMHFNRTISAMESKIVDGCSDEICKEKETLLKSRACDDQQHTASDASNLVSTCSSHDSLSENAESKVTTRISETSGAEHAEMLPKMALKIDGNQHTTQCNTSSQSAVTSHASIPSAASKITSSQDNKQQAPEHHGDNISCVTGAKEENIGDSDKQKALPRDALTSSIVVDGLEKSSQAEPASGCITDSSHGIEDCKNNPAILNTSMEGVPHKNSSGVTAAANVVSERPLSKDVCEGSVTLKSELPLSPSKSRPSSQFFPKDSAEKSGCQLEANPHECVLEHLESSSAGQVTGAMNDRTKESSANPSIIEDGKKTLVKSNSATGSLVKIHPLSETEIDMNIKEAPAESIKKSDLDREVENPHLLHQASGVQDKQQSPICDGENSESDILEDDVKVCDICGDAGREDYLAICSRCSDGAEHTYCMKVMLDKVPEGDWLCEECQLKDDAEKQRMNKKAQEEEIQAAPKAPSLSERSQNLNTKPKLDTKADDDDQEQVSKIIASPRASTKRLPEILEASPAPKKMAVEAGSGTPRMSTFSKSSILSKESSFKRVDLGKVKPVSPLPSSGSQPANNSVEATYAHSATGSITSKLSQQLKSPQGSLSRSATFNNSKHKVKQLPDDFSQNMKLPGSSIKKDGSIRTMGRSLSFKSIGSSHSNSNDSKAKLQSANFSRAVVDPRGLKQVKDQILEKKNSSRADRPIFSSSSSTVTNMSHVKSDVKAALHSDAVPSQSLTGNALDLKSAQHNGKRHALSKTANAVAHDGSEVKKHGAVSRGPGVSLNGMSISEEQKPCQVGPREDATAGLLAADKISGSSDFPTTNRDGKSKDSTLSRLKHTVPYGSKNVRCQRCNEMGHDMQACKEVSLQFLAFKDSAVRNLRDSTNKSSKWNDATEPVVPKTPKNDKPANQPEVLTVPNTETNCQVAPRDHLPSSSLSAPFLSKDALRCPIDSSRTSTPFNLQQQYMEEEVCASREAELNFVPTITDEKKLKLSSASSPFQASVLGKPLRISAIPEHDCIWQGSFEVKKNGFHTDIYDGIQAHLSTCASPGVVEVVKKFPSRIRLVEAPQQTTWPPQFQRNCTTEDKIALYFFARDLHSYERNYRKLLENMLVNDLALKGNLDGVELLIFPSNQLHEKSQRWNRLFFLWAVFIGRSCSESVANSHKKYCGTVLDAESRQKDSSTVVVGNELPKNESSPRAKAEKSSFGIHPALSSSGQIVASLEQRCLGSWEVNQSDAVSRHSPEGHPSCSSCETQSIESASQQGYQPNNHSLLRKTEKARLCSEAKDSCTSLKESYRDSGGGSVNELKPIGTQVQIDLNEGSEDSGSKEKLQGWHKEELARSRTSEGEMHVEVAVKEHQGSHSWSGRKCLHPSSSETASEVSGKMFDVSSQSTPWEKAEGVESDRENESKKMKLHHDLHVVSNAHGQMLEDGFSSMARSGDLVFLKEKGDCSYDRAIPLFPLDTGPISNCKSGNPSEWQILKSDIKDPPEPDIPDLELALGAEKKPSKQQGSFPWLSGSLDERTTQSKLPPAEDGNDDVSSSLSLSLAFPFPRKEQPTKPTPKPEQLLPEKNHLSTSLLLFGRFRDP